MYARNPPYPKEVGLSKGFQATLIIIAQSMTFILIAMFYGLHSAVSCNRLQEEFATYLERYMPVQMHQQLDYGREKFD